jgi:hypothetical protein
MKKILVVLLILGIAGGLFAQDAGTFTWSGFVRSGVSIDLDNDNNGGDPKTDDAVVPVNVPIDKSYGEAKLAYKKESAALQVEGVLGVNKATQITSNVGVYWGDTYGGELPYLGAFSVKSEDGAGVFNLTAINKAYGYLYFLDRQLQVEAAYKGRDDAKWAIPVFDFSWDNLDGKGGFRIDYTPKAVAGLSVGARIGGNFSAVDDNGDSVYGTTLPGTVRNKDYLRDTTLGAKYAPESFPLTAVFITNFVEDKESAAVSVKYGILLDTLSVTAELRALNLGDYGDTGELDILGKVEYINGPIVTSGLTVKALGLNYGYWEVAGSKYSTWGDLENVKADDVGTQVDDDAGALSRVEFTPFVGYQIIDKILQARLEATIGLGLGDKAKDYGTLSVSPGLFYNIKGDKNTNEPETGIWVKYNIGTALKTPSKSKGWSSDAQDMVKPYTHRLDVMFSYTF